MVVKEEPPASAVIVASASVTFASTAPTAPPYVTADDRVVAVLILGVACPASAYCLKAVSFRQL